MRRVIHEIGTSMGHVGDGDGNGPGDGYGSGNG
jgi:hypothetical protein